MRRRIRNQGVWSQGEVGGVTNKDSWVEMPLLANEFVGCFAPQALEASAVVPGQ